MTIENELREYPGVIKAAVSIYKPYAALVIYDGKKTSIADILKSVHEGALRTRDLSDVPIDKLPVVVVPKIRAGEPGTPEKAKAPRTGS